MAVVAHHPVVIQLEGIFRGRLVVDVYLPVSDFQLVAFVSADGPLVDGVVGVEVVAQLDGVGQVDGGALLGNPDGAIVVA